MPSEFEQLTLKQISLIPSHVDKWRKTALSTARLDKQQAIKTVNAIYRILGYELPQILFFESPYAACNFIKNQTEQQLKNLLGKKRDVDFAANRWYELLAKNIYSQIDPRQVFSRFKDLNAERHYHSLSNLSEWGRWESFDHQVDNHILSGLDYQVRRRVEGYLGRPRGRYIKHQRIFHSICEFDYYLSIFNLDVEQKDWHTFKSLFQLGTHIYLQEKACLICDRPLKMFFDNNRYYYYLHAEGKPALEYVDGSRLYSYHCVTLPEKYGRLSPQYWQPKWLLKETDPLVREVLVRGISYIKLSKELSVTELDNMYDFMVISIDISSRSSLVYLLEININNGSIERAKEVPSKVKTVVEAASFVDEYEEWDISPESCTGREIPF